MLDSGIRWNDAGAMGDLRRKTRLNKGELPLPAGLHAVRLQRRRRLQRRPTTPATRASTSATPRRVGPPGVMTPQDLLIAFSDGNDDDCNGFVDDIAGWDFLDDDNDAFDDVAVRPRHRRGERLNRRGQQRAQRRLLPELHVHPDARRRLVRRGREQLRARPSSTASTTARS